MRGIVIAVDAQEKCSGVRLRNYTRAASIHRNTIIGAHDVLAADAIDDSLRDNFEDVNSGRWLQS